MKIFEHFAFSFAEDPENVREPFPEAMTKDVGDLKENTSQTNQPVRFKKVQTIFTILQRLHPRTSYFIFRQRNVVVTIANVVACYVG